MKKLWMIFLFFVPLFSPAQKKKDNVIIIKTDTAGIFNQALNILYDNGYTIQTADRVNGVILSEEKTVKNALVKLRIRVKDSSVLLSGQVALAMEISFGSATMTKTFEPVYYGGSKNSPLRSAWNELNTIALKIGSQIEYAKTQ